MHHGYLCWDFGGYLCLNCVGKLAGYVQIVFNSYLVLIVLGSWWVRFGLCWVAVFGSWLFVWVVWINGCLCLDRVGWLG